MMLTAGCDDGRIYPTDSTVATDGLNVTVDCEIIGASGWNLSSDYHLALAAFGTDGSRYATVSSNINASNGSGRLALSSVPQESATIEVCVLDRLRKRVISFASFELAGAPVEGDTVRLSAASPIEADLLSALQSNVFTPTCSACHGGGALPAASLSLMPGQTLGMLVGVDSHLTPAMKRVAPGLPDSSLLYRALTTDLSASWAYDHSVEVVDNDMRALLRLWIESLGSELTKK